MLKYFFIIFGFLVLVVIAMAGFRGHKSGQPPIEISRTWITSPR